MPKSYPSKEEPGLNISATQQINILAQIADLKEIAYRQSLIISALVELLLEKGIITQNELISRAWLLNASDGEFN